MISLVVSPGVDFEKITGLDHSLRAWNAMHNFIVDARADRGREAVIALDTRGCAHLTNPALGINVKISSRLARLGHLHDLA